MAAPDIPLEVLQLPDRLGRVDTLRYLLERSTVLSFPDLPSKRHMLHALLDRERICSTGIGKGVAIPHSRSIHAPKLGMMLGVSASGINWKALDNLPVDLVFLLIAPMNQGNVYLKGIARASRLLRLPRVRDRIRENAASLRGLWDLRVFFDHVE